MKGLYFKLFTHRYVAVIVLLSPLFLLACSGCHSGNGGGKEDSLENRVKTFWERRIASEDIKAYEFEEYAKKRSMPVEQYVRSRNPALHYKTYKIKGIEESGDSAIVKIDVGYNLSLPGRGQFNTTMEITDRWVRLDGKWYRQEAKKEQKLSAQVQ